MDAALSLEPPAGAPSRRWVVPTVALCTVLAIALMGYFVKGLMGHSGQTKKPPKITMITPAALPPPPPPPPKFEKKPDPPKDQKEMKVEAPQPKPESPPPSPELKMDGPAGNGPSAFGAGKITSEDLSKIGAGKPGGTGGGEKTGMFNPFNNYATLAKGELQRYLGKRDNLRRKRYALEVHLWVLPTGAVSRFELVGGTGDADTDEVISQALAALPPFTQTLPPNMPQPIRLRISTGG